MSYDSSLSTSKDRVRWLIGDTDTDNEYAKDEEIQWALTQEKNVYMAAAAVAMAIYRKNREGGVQELTVGETKIKYDRAMEFRALAEDLRMRGSTYKVPSAGGVYEDDRETYEEDTDLIQPAFGVGMHDNPNADEVNEATDLD